VVQVPGRRFVPPQDFVAGGFTDAIGRITDDWGLRYPGVQRVEHVYFFAPHAVGEGTRQDYLQRAYRLGQDFDRGPVPAAPGDRRQDDAEGGRAEPEVVGGVQRVLAPEHEEGGEVEPPRARKGAAASRDRDPQCIAFLSDRGLLLQALPLGVEVYLRRARDLVERLSCRTLALQDLGHPHSTTVPPYIRGHQGPRRVVLSHAQRVHEGLELGILLQDR
jgi:hypothetical protein